MGTAGRTAAQAAIETAPALASGGPNPRRTQAQRREEAEQRILGAALDIIVARGLDALTLGDAGTRAGFSKNLPLHYFSTKNDLVAAVAKYILRTYGAELSERTKDMQGFAKLMASIGFYFDYPLQNSAVTRAYHIVLDSALSKPELRPLVAKIHRSGAQEIYSALKRALDAEAAGRSADLRTLSVLTYSALLGAVAQWLVDPKAINLPATRDAVISNLQAALGPRPGGS
jgi:AcrR family transcriptional regulator